jgi:hypothetical protein
MGEQSSRLDFLRDLAESQGVSPSDEDLEAVSGFLDAILPALARIEETLPPDESL